jgi:hypothetical protein
MTTFRIVFYESFLSKVTEKASLETDKLFDPLASVHVEHEGYERNAEMSKKSGHNSKQLTFLYFQPYIFYLLPVSAVKKKISTKAGT